MVQQNWSTKRCLYRVVKEFQGGAMRVGELSIAVIAQPSRAQLSSELRQLLSSELRKQQQRPPECVIGFSAQLLPASSSSSSSFSSCSSSSFSSCSSSSCLFCFCFWRSSSSSSSSCSSSNSSFSSSSSSCSCSCSSSCSYFSSCSTLWFWKMWLFVRNWYISWGAGNTFLVKKHHASNILSFRNLFKNLNRDTEVTERA